MQGYVWQAYLKVVARKTSQEINILYRFQILKKFNEALDGVRRIELMRMKQNEGRSRAHVDQKTMGFIEVS